MYYLYYKTSFILYVKKFERVTWNCIAPSNGFRPSEKGGGGGVIHTRIEGGPGLKNFFSALRASVWSKNKREAGPAGPSPMDAPLAPCKVIKDTLGFWIPRS